MLNTVYQLKRPRQFEAVFKNVELDSRHILVRPTHLSICNADQRYYQGTRDKEILKRKLPMALIHEGIGRVVYDPTGVSKLEMMSLSFLTYQWKRMTLLMKTIYIQVNSAPAMRMDSFRNLFVHALTGC